MPTLFDFDDINDRPLCPGGTGERVESAFASDISVALAEWDDDETETCFDV